ncbi:MAG: hypothetical protein DRN49_06045 [Thaumarchaeota archaeon]|nr:MAG: hypothetical protein DRN49_06045 [Nitrososphaerota archaeon]
MWEEKVVCPHCGRMTNKAPYCKYCGKPLNSSNMESSEEGKPESEKPEEEIVIEKVGEEVLERKPPVQEISEERKIVEQLANVYNWRNRLLELFLNGEASTEVFMDIYKEYRNRIKAVNSKRLEMIRSLEDRISELNSKLEQLKIRHEIGEVPDKQYITEKLSIDRELSKIKPRLNILHNAFDVKLADLPEYEAKIREFRDRISSEGSSKGLSEEDVNMIVSDLDETLESLKDLLELHKKLKKELEKIELRYKVGELTEEEYLAAKQKIERQMEI